MTATGRLATFVALLVLCTPAASSGQASSDPFDGPPPMPPDVHTAFLVTVGQGDAVWERFGHNIIWIHDPEARTDEGYNYGLFSFEQENFLLRFIKGQMLYWMGGADVQAQLRSYASQDRPIWIQQLALTPAEVRELQDFLEWNERPENRDYRYHYYRDNCSTRVRDALDRVLGGSLSTWARARPTGETYRDHTLRLTEDVFWAGTGLHFGMGPSTDLPLSAWEAMFIPMELQEHLRDFRRGRSGANGASEGEPIVVREWIFHDVAGGGPPAETPRRTWEFLGAGVLAAAFLVLLGSAPRRSTSPWRGWRAALITTTVPVLAAVAFVGLLFAFLWAFTDHVDTRWNQNLLQAGPLHLVLAAVWPLARRKAWAARAAPVVAGAILLLSLLGLALEALPGIEQTNGEFLALLVPFNAALAWTVWRLEAGRP